MIKASRSLSSSTSNSSLGSLKSSLSSSGMKKFHKVRFQDQNEPDNVPATNYTVNIKELMWKEEIVYSLSDYTQRPGNNENSKKGIYFETAVGSTELGYLIDLEGKLYQVRKGQFQDYFLPNYEEVELINYELVYIIKEDHTERVFCLHKSLVDRSIRALKDQFEEFEDGEIYRMDELKYSIDPYSVFCELWKKCRKNWSKKSV